MSGACASSCRRASCSGCRCASAWACVTGGIAVVRLVHDLKLDLVPSSQPPSNPPRRTCRIERATAAMSPGNRNVLADGRRLRRVGPSTHAARQPVADGGIGEETVPQLVGCDRCRWCTQALAISVAASAAPGASSGAAQILQAHAGPSAGSAASCAAMNLPPLGSFVQSGTQLPQHAGLASAGWRCPAPGRSAPTGPRR